jgi:hypothetical protein
LAQTNIDRLPDFVAIKAVTPVSHGNACSLKALDQHSGFFQQENLNHPAPDLEALGEHYKLAFGTSNGQRAHNKEDTACTEIVMFDHSPIGLGKK